jgi:hypothetical protein
VTDREKIGSASPSTPAGKKKSPWWLPIAVVLGALPAVFAIGIFFFVLYTGYMHEESRCPFHDVETRALDAHVSVVQQERQCVEAVEEFRWRIVRDGAAPMELGRLPQERIGHAVPWEARLEDGRVIIDITNEPRGMLTVREPFPDGGTGFEMPRTE